jgi:Predicted sugar kinase
MKVALYGRYFPSSHLDCLKILFERFGQNGVKIKVFEPFYASLVKELGYTPKDISVFNTPSELDMDTSCLFSLGGDGTFLETVALVRDTGIPIAGINAGRLGFLTSISCEYINEVIDSLLGNTLSVENRSLIMVEGLPLPLSEFPYALNEVSIQKQGSSMVSVTVYHNDGLINTYWSDGLLVATPTGSTAYSLSVGGPIITPDSASFVISPIAPHNLTVRPLVVPDSYRLRIEPTSRDENVIVAIDNRSMPIASGSRLIISKAPFTVKILKLGETDFFKRLRTKLMWGVDKRS